ncbi:MAG: putative DNA binding domain-containing protein [Prevotellaceae bacterium]|nr:putative DNA binding domain-containing protein [Prevotellaceae bacterium]
MIKQGEGAHTEFKRAFNQEIIVTLNAFVNTEGGKVFVGVDDNGVPVGVSLAKETIGSWINAVKSKTTPSITPDAEVFEYKKKTIVVLSVKEYPVKPVSVQGRYYRRVKNSNHQLSLSEISDLYLKTFHSSWDYHIDSLHQLDDISIDKVNAFSSKIMRETSENDPMRILRKYELIRDERLTHAAFLLFVKDFTPLTGIEAGRFKSSTKIIDSVSIHCDLFSEVDEVLAFIRKHLMTEYIITGKAQREERFDYPEEAIREIVLNMIVHRNYQDSGDSIIKIFDNRIEFFNPGQLMDNLTVEQLLSDNYTPKARNTLINTMFKEIGLVEKYGSGIKRIMNACIRHGGCNVRFLSFQHGFMVVLSRSVEKTEKSVEKIDNGVEKSVEKIDGSVEKSDDGVEKSVEKILKLIQDNPKITQMEISRITGLTRRGVEKNISMLKTKGLIEREGAGRGGYWKVIKKEN